MPLNEQQWNLVTYLEQIFLAEGSLPSAERVEELGLISATGYREFLKKPEVRDNLLARGIRLEENKAGALTELQLTVANTLLDLTDNRSRKKKLADLGVSTQKYEAWLKDSAFQNYLRTRAEGILGDNLHEAHLALLDRVRSGDTNALKFYYEITGRYVPANQGNIDILGLLMKVMEIIQRHVREDEVVEGISDDLLTLASGVGIGVGASKTKMLEAL